MPATQTPDTANTFRAAKATIAYQGAFSYSTMHVRDVECEAVEYAQYTNAVRVTFIKKGARKRTGMVLTYEPSMVIIDGHVEIDIPKTMGAEDASGCSMSRGMSCDPMWAKEFDAALKASGHKVLKDYRGHNAHSKFSA